MTVAVASGKGGTGKTLVATNLAVALAREGARVALVDCDVEAPNDHLFFDTEAPKVTEVLVPRIEVDAERCNACGVCRDACAYGALRILGRTVVVFDELCHGCGLCLTVCPRLALSETPRRIGEVRTVRAETGGSGAAATAGELTLVGGRLDVGEVRSPEVIRHARELAAELRPDVIVLDAPPGVACSVVASLRGADLIILVAEDTPFGLHDLRLSIDLAEELRIPAIAVENRGNGAGSFLESISRERGVPVRGHIPFDRRIAQAYATGRLVADESKEVAEVIAGLAAEVRRSSDAEHEMGEAR